MWKSLFSILIPGFLSTQVLAAPVEKIVTRILYAGETDSVRRLFNELKLRNHLYAASDEEIWIADQSYDRYEAYNIDGKFLREFELPRDTSDGRHRWICGFEDGRVCYLALIDTPFVQTQGKFALLKWDCENGNLERNDLDYSGPDFKGYKKRYIWYELMPMFLPKFEAGYFLGDHGGGFTIVFDRQGQYLGKVPFNFWCAAGFGLALAPVPLPPSLRDYDWRFVFVEQVKYEKDMSKYVFGSRQTRKDVIFNPYSTISDSLEQHPEYIGMDESGFVYLINIKIKYSPEHIEIRLVRFDPLRNRAVQSTQRMILPGGSQLFHVLDRIVTPNGLILLSILQPDLETVQGMLARMNRKEPAKRLSNSPPNLNYYVYRIDTSAIEWSDCPLRTLDYKR